MRFSIAYLAFIAGIQRSNELYLHIKKIGSFPYKLFNTRLMTELAALGSSVS